MKNKNRDESEDESGDANTAETSDESGDEKMEGAMKEGELMVVCVSRGLGRLTELSNLVG